MISYLILKIISWVWSIQLTGAFSNPLEFFFFVISAVELVVETIFGVMFLGALFLEITLLLKTKKHRRVKNLVRKE